MIEVATARHHQARGQQVTNARYISTRTFPRRYLASPLYRQELAAEVDAVLDAQTARIMERLDRRETFEGEAWGPRQPLASYDCEVRR